MMDAMASWEKGRGITYAANLTREIMGLPQPAVAALEDAECDTRGGDPETCGCAERREEAEKLEAAYEAACERGVYHGRKPHLFNREGE